MTQPISFDQPLGQVRDQRVYVDSAWFRYFVDVGEVDLTADVTGILPIANGGTGVTTGLAPEAVQVPTLLNGWVNFSPAYHDAGYYKDSGGLVHLRGLVALGTVGLSIFALPAAYMPLKLVQFPVVSNGLFGYVQIDTSGNVTLLAGSNVNVSLSGITFRVDA